MARHTFFCIDGHTCGNPVRVVAGGAPRLRGENMLEKRAHFVEEYDWVRTGLMFEPRGHDVMSGAILMEPTRPDCDVAILFIETSGCLPMCGHGTIGTVTIAIENGLIKPRVPGVLKLDTPAGVVTARYTMSDGCVEEVRITNVPSFLYQQAISADCPGLGQIAVDVAYGGNFYAIVDIQKNFHGIAEYSAADLIRFSPLLRAALNRKYDFNHPQKTDIKGLSHILWCGQPTVTGATAKNAVFYGDKAIDRSPCGTGTSARMAQWVAKDKLGVGDEFIHESYIGSLFKGRIEEQTTVGRFSAIVPSIAGWARVTGHNTIFIDERDPFAHGFVVR